MMDINKVKISCDDDKKESKKDLLQHLRTQASEDGRSIIVTHSRLTCVRERIGEEASSVPFYRDVVAEFVGTMVLVAIQCLLPLSWGSDDPAAAVRVGLGMGFVVCAMANSVGDFGGGHFNPAVTIAMTSCLKITPFRGLLYVVAQCLGGICGAAMSYGFTPADHREGLAATTLHPDVSPLAGMCIELFITFNLVLVILGSTNGERKSDVYMPPIPIGFTIAMNIMSAKNSTGASMNPARSLGPAVLMGIWENHWVYWVGPILGGLLAVCLYCGFLDRAESFQQTLHERRVRDSQGDPLKMETNKAEG